MIRGPFRTEAGLLVPALLLALGLATGCSRKPAPLNLLLVTLDTTRPDRLRCYGNRRIETPHLDRLAREGVVFDDAVSVAPITLPAHSSIMTGLTPMAHGVRDNGDYRLGDDALTMAELLAERGYETTAVIGAFVLHSGFGLAQGFERYDEDLSGGRMDDAFHFLERTADRVTDAACSWLDGRETGRPFFLWVHYFDPHAEYEPPSPYRERYTAMPYDGEIAFTDGQLGRLVEELERRDLWKHTLVVVIGDHGESLGEHGEKTHGNLAYDATLRVPFLLSHPDGRGEAPGTRWKARRVAEQVQQIDVFPTIAELLEVPLVHPVEGTSLVPLLDGKAVAERPAYAETLSPHLTYGWAPLRVVRTGAMKYIRAPVPELYDLAKDPHERRNLASGEPDVVARFEAELTGLATRAAGAAVASTGTELSAEAREKLASLGYLQGGSPEAAHAELDPAELLHPDPKSLMAPLDQLLEPGIAALERGNLAEAESLLRSYLALDPGCGEAHFYLGLTLRSAGRFDQALGELETAARLSPRDSKIPLHIGILQGMAAKNTEARAAFEASLILSPHALEPHFALGALDEDEDRAADALTHYDHVLAADSTNATAHLLRGALLGKMGRGDEATRELRRATELVPRSGSSLQAFGRKLGEMGHADLALPLFEELARTRPEDPLVRMSLGNCYLLAGDNARAADEYAAAVRLSPGESQYHYLLGCAYGGLGEYDKARGAWEKALEINPGHREARHNLELLRSGAVTRVHR